MGFLREQRASDLTPTCRPGDGGYRAQASGIGLRQHFKLRERSNAPPALPARPGHNRMVDVGGPSRGQFPRQHPRVELDRFLPAFSRQAHPGGVFVDHRKRCRAAYQLYVVSAELQLGSEQDAPRIKIL
jgi:hypothetical protein